MRPKNPLFRGRAGLDRAGDDRRLSRGARRRGIVADIPLGRVASTDEIAEVIRWLSIDAPASATGSIIDANGAAMLLPVPRRRGAGSPHRHPVRQAEAARKATAPIKRPVRSSRRSARRATMSPACPADPHLRQHLHRRHLRHHVILITDPAGDSDDGGPEEAADLSLPCPQAQLRADRHPIHFAQPRALR